MDVQYGQCCLVFAEDGTVEPGRIVGRYEDRGELGAMVVFDSALDMVRAPVGTVGGPLRVYWDGRARRLPPRAIWLN